MIQDRPWCGRKSFPRSVQVTNVIFPPSGLLCKEYRIITQLWLPCLLTLDCTLGASPTAWKWTPHSTCRISVLSTPCFSFHNFHNKVLPTHGSHTFKEQFILNSGNGLLEVNVTQSNTKDGFHLSHCKCTGGKGA